MNDNNRYGVSVGIPVYNEAAHIRAAILSAVPQADEIVIFDNASTDGTSDICAELAEAHPHIRYERRPKNVGAPQNFLSCLEAATGEFFMFLGGHDRIAADYIPLLADILQEDDGCVMAFGKALHISNDDAFVSEYVYDFHEELNSQSPVERIMALMAKLYDCTCYHGLYRRHSFLEAHENVPQCCGADHIVLTNIAAAGRMRYEEKAGYFRRDKHGPETADAARDRLRAAFALKAEDEYLLRYDTMCERQMEMLQKAVADSGANEKIVIEGKRILAKRFPWKSASAELPPKGWLMLLRRKLLRGVHILERAKE